MLKAKYLHGVQFFIILLSHGFCQPKKDASMEVIAKGSLTYDLDFLQQHDPNLVMLEDEVGAVVIVSPKYQGKVFTSSNSRNSELSFGWINYEAIKSDVIDPHMNAYGGESRMWLGPEGGQYSIFFDPNEDFIFENWETPSAIDHESWKLLTRSPEYVKMEKRATFKSYSEVTFETILQREVSMLSPNQLLQKFGLGMEGLDGVAYKTRNKIINNGDIAWDEASGSICIWILDMFAPSESTVVLLPYNENSAVLPIVKSDYFGKVPEDRLAVKDGLVYFKADGKKRGKIGIGPQRAFPYAGSIDLVNNVLTVVEFDLDSTASYLNQEWRLQKDPYLGDAINAYNDGPLEDGSQMGPFYEIESTSPAAFLQPGDSILHLHSVFHFVGDADQLGTMAKSIFGADINDIKDFLQ